MITRCLLAIVTLLVLVGVTVACELPTAAEMRQIEFSEGEQTEVSDAVIADIAALYDNVRAGLEPETITRTFTEKQLTALIAEQIAGAEDVPVSDVLINIDPDAFLIAATLIYEGDTHEVVADLSWVVNASGDALEITIDDFTIDAIPGNIIEGLSDGFERQINAGLQAATGDLTMEMSSITVPEGATIESIELGDGEMTISGTVDAELLE